MRGIVFGTKNRPESFAGAAMDNPQELALGDRTAVPIFLENDASTVLKDKTGYIDRCSASMRRTPIAARNVATGIAAHGLDPHQRATKNLASRAVNPEARPIAESGGGFTFNSAEIADAELRTIA